jgi:dCMP deaminase
MMDTVRVTVSEETWELIRASRRRPWNIRFLNLAEHISTWSKDPSTKVGAVIANPNKIVVGMGYNGFPRGVIDSEERYNDRAEKYPRVVHAELNAILNATGWLNDCTIYVYPTLMIPAACPNCAQAIIQSGIKEIVCWHSDDLQDRWHDMSEISASMFKEAGVRVTTVIKD